MNTSNIFDLSNLSDLPEDISRKVSSRRLGGITMDMIAPLFHLKDDLSANEIMVALWRRNQINAKKQTINCSLKALREKGIIRRCGYAVYKLNEKTTKKAKSGKKAK